MTFQKCSFGKKLVTVATSVALVASMAVVAPVTTAVASETEVSSVTVLTTAASVDAGSQLQTAPFFSCTLGDDSYHVDYTISDTTHATINKHSGILTATSAGVVTVTASITSGERGNSSSSICGGADAVVAYGSMTVTINDAQVNYTYQGVNGNTIKMISPTVSNVSGNDTTGYTNALDTLTPDSDGIIKFTYSQTAGLNNTSIATYLEKNASNIALVRNNGATIANVSADTNSVFYISDINSSEGTVTLAVNTEKLAPTSAKIVFASGLCGNNTSKNLGISVTFTFSY